MEPILDYGNTNSVNFKLNSKKNESLSKFSQLMTEEATCWLREAKVWQDSLGKNDPK